MVVDGSYGICDGSTCVDVEVDVKVEKHET
jgi:hypothetical protein